MYRQSNYIGNAAAASAIAQKVGKPVDIHPKYPLPRDTYCARSPRLKTSCYTTIFYQILAPSRPIRQLPEKVMIHVDECTCASLFANLAEKDFGLLAEPLKRRHGRFAEGYYIA